MYRVMIIDDEKALRNLLKAAVDWQEMGLEVVGEAASGIEAINIIDKLHPDIIFVDIRMPLKRRLPCCRERACICTLRI